MKGIKVRQVLSQLQVTVRLLHPGHHQMALWTTMPCSGGVGVRRPLGAFLCQVWASR